jgi:capsular polysaccharide biosynthesis protein
MKPHLRKIIGLAALVVGLALCGVGLWVLLSLPQYAATVRIKIEQDNELIGVFTYDPHFIQTSFEIIKSQLVLSNVVADLNLKDVWGKEHFYGEPLKTARCYAILRRHLRLTSIGNTKFVDITYYGDTPKEAADVANAVAESYQKYRVESLTIQRLRGIEALQQQFQNEDKQIIMLQTNVEQLRQKYGIQDGVSTNRLPQQQPYWNAKKQLNGVREFHKRLAIKIKAEKLDMNISKANWVPIIHRAEPAQFPVHGNRPLGAVLLVVGLFLLLGGILLLKSKP